jgi:hypothetical protein
MVAWWSFDTFNHVLQKKTKNNIRRPLNILFPILYIYILNAQKNHPKNNIS